MGHHVGHDLFDGALSAEGALPAVVGENLVVARRCLHLLDGGALAHGLDDAPGILGRRGSQPEAAHQRLDEVVVAAVEQQLERDRPAQAQIEIGADEGCFIVRGYPDTTSRGSRARYQVVWCCQVCSWAGSFVGSESILWSSTYSAAGLLVDQTGSLFPLCR